MKHARPSFVTKEKAPQEKAKELLKNSDQELHKMIDKYSEMQEILPEAESFFMERINQHLLEAHHLIHKVAAVFNNSKQQTS